MIKFNTIKDTGIDNPEKYYVIFVLKLSRY